MSKKLITLDNLKKFRTTLNDNDLGPSLFLSDSDTGEWVGAPIRSKSGVVMSDTEPTDTDVLWFKPL
jgi:hypothetical protein